MRAFSQCVSRSAGILVVGLVAGRLPGQGQVPGGVRVQRLSTAPSASARREGRSLAPTPLAADVAARLRARLDALQDGKAPATPLTRLAPGQRTGFLALRARSGGIAEVRMRRESGTPLEIRGGVLEPASLDAVPGENAGERTARAFLRGNSDLLRLDDPDSELTLLRDETDDLGKRHLRFSQSWLGLPVWPAEVLVHLDAAGNVERMSGAYIATPREAAVDPILDAGTAARRASMEVPGGQAVRAGEPLLFIYAPGDTAPRLAWKVEVPVTVSARWMVVVDASSGAVLASFNQVMHENVPGSGVDLSGATRALNLWSEGGRFFVVDTSKPMFDPASNPPSPATTRGGIAVVDARNQPPGSEPTTIPPVFPLSSESATSGHLADGVSAAFGLSETYDYYLERHSRDSIDGRGGTILAIVRLGQGFQNAFWHSNQMVFGDGLPFAGALDVVAHELTHGVTESSANLIYMNQSGALNEAFSDIFGEAVEARTLGRADWEVGASLGQPLRKYIDPSSFPCCFGRNYPSRLSEFIQTQEDNGGVHINSTIITHGFYLLAEGLPGAIGIGDAERIFYRALTTKLVSNSKFIDARLACIASAEELFGPGSPQATRTAESFDAIEILDGSGTPDPDPGPIVSGPDAVVFLYADPDSGNILLGRREEALGDAEIGEQLAARPLKAARPSVTGDGSVAAFVDASDDACLVSTAVPGSEECLGFPGRIASIAVSPSGDLFAFVLLDEEGQPDNTISVVDLGPGGGTRTFRLEAPAADGPDLGTVLFADTMDFTADGRFLIYDAITELVLEDGSAIGAWSIFALDLGTDSFITLVPPTPGRDIGFPSLGQRDDRLITFDAVDTATGASTIVAANLITGHGAIIATLDRPGMPVYTGDDAAIVFTAPDGETFSGFSLISQGVGQDGIVPEGAPELFLPDAAFGVIYRRGAFAGLVRDLAVISIKAPRRIGLSARKPSVTKGVKVKIQNRGPDVETITDLTMLRSLVSLGVASMGGCDAPVAVMRVPRKRFPIRLKPKAKLSIVFDVTFDCANDPLKTTSRDPGHDDFTYTAVIDRTALDGEADTHPGDDTCPRSVTPPFEVDPSNGTKDRGCGAKKSDRTYGGDVLTDVVLK